MSTSLHAAQQDQPSGTCTPVSSRPYGFGLTSLGALGLVSAFMLTVDKFNLLEDPSFVPSCNLSPILSCGSVMVTDQASVFGFPNPLLGLVGFTVVVVLGVLLTLRTPLPNVVHVGLAVGSVAGLAFVHWLAFQSLYRIGALCPWCMVVWAVTIPLAVWSVLTAARAITHKRQVEMAWSVRYLIVLFWYLAFVVLILIRFWDYWRTLL